jgi:hypothetical protein
LDCLVVKPGFYFWGGKGLHFFPFIYKFNASATTSLTPFSPHGNGLDFSLIHGAIISVVRIHFPCVSCSTLASLATAVLLEWATGRFRMTTDSATFRINLE